MSKKAIQAYFEPVKAKIIELYAQEIERSLADTLRIIVNNFISSKKLAVKYAPQLQNFKQK